MNDRYNKPTSQDNDQGMKENTRQGTDHLEAGKEKNKKEKVTTDDLKGKKVDAFPDTKEDQPISQNDKNKN